MKRTIESYIIYLREDLRIADSCHLIKDRLLEAILNGSYLSKEFAGYFTRANPNLPFAISATDPDQVAILKKLINALENTEKTLRSIEDLDIRRERYTPALLKDAIKTSYYAIHEIYAVLQIINTSNADIQNIIAPYLKTLLPKMALASQALNQFSPQHHGEQAAALLGQAVTMLPTEYTTPYQGLGNISSLIFQLPQYFEKLQQLISTGISGIADLSITTPREYQERIERETKELQDHLHSFTTKNGVRAFPSFLLIVKKLVSHSSELINSAAPLTKTAYNNAVKQLHKIKHDLLPQLLAELEMMEESMGLKTGILTDAVLQQIDAYYTSLSDQVQKIAMASGILDATSETMSESLEKLVRFIANDRGQLDTGPKITPELQLSVMMDDVFIEKRRDAQLTRLSEARLEAENTSALEAASRFFGKIGTYSPWLYYWSLANISQDEKNALIAEYKLFQPYLAPLYPDIDALIVQALTQYTGNTGLSKLYYSEYQQLWGSNHFKKILACKDGVLTSISQHQAQAQFNAKLIEQTLAHAESAIDKAHLGKTHLSREAYTFQPLAFILEDGKTPEHYHAKALSINKQIYTIEKAQMAVEQFFEYLEQEVQSKNRSLDQLNETDKRILRVIYRKYQPFLRAIDQEGIDTRIEHFLANNKPSGRPLSLLDLIKIRPTIDASLSEHKDNSIQAQKRYLDQEHQARETQEKPIPLRPKGEELAPKNLFKMLSNLKLSQSVDEFLNKTLQEYLKNNLATLVWNELSSDGETLDFSKLPYLEFHQDSPEVAMYKQLLNSVYYIKIGLEKLESLNIHNDPTDILHRSRFVVTAFNALIMNISYSKYYLSQATANPGLQVIIKQGLDLLKPLQEIPFIGDYLIPPNKPAVDLPKPTIIEAWKAQQHIVHSSLLSAPKPLATKASPAEPDIREPPSATTQDNKSNLQLIAEQLYQLPIYLRQLKERRGGSDSHRVEVEANVKAFVDSLSGLSLDSKSTKKLLHALASLQTQLSMIGTLGRELIIDQELKAIHTEFLALLMSMADTAEFHLGLKPGTYSDLVLRRFEQLYSVLISNTPLGKKQAELHLITDNAITHKRLLEEQGRLESIKQGTPAEDTRKAIFGDDYEHSQKIYKAYFLLKQALSDIDTIGHEYGETFEEVKIDVEAAYKVIQPFLASINPLFNGQFIAECSDKSSLLIATQELFSARETIYKPTTSFVKLKNLYLQCDFTKQEDREQFLLYYAEIQAILLQLNYKFDLVYFLRELQTPEDFEQALEQIVHEEDRLNQLIDSKERTKQCHISRCSERIDYFTSLVKRQEEELIPAQVEAFKGKVFDEYINRTLSNALKTSLGNDTEVFFQHLIPELLKKKAELLKDLTIKEDIETVIASRVEAFIASQRDSFKTLLFNNQLKNNITTQLNGILGIYTSVFISLVIPSFAERQAAALKATPLTPDLRLIVEGQAKEVMPEIMQANPKLKKLFLQLNKTLEQINQLIAQEEVKPQKNPCRNEKLALLTSLKSRLIAIDSIPATDVYLFFHTMYSQTQQQLHEMENYNSLIDVVDTLSSLKVSIQSEEHQSQKDKAEKISVIDELQDILGDTKIKPAIRLHLITRKLSGEPNESPLRRSKYSVFGQIIKNQAFSNYINKQVKEQLATDLGVFSDVFLRLTRPDFIAKRTQILQAVHIDNLETDLADMFTQLTQEVCNLHKDLYALCKRNNELLNQVEFMLEQERAKHQDNNPCRSKKIIDLEAYREFLIESKNIPPEFSDVKEHLQKNVEVMDVLINKLSTDDTLITAYDQLIEMEKYVHESDQSTPIIKSEKLMHIHAMQKILTSPLEQKKRIAELRSYCSKDQCKSDLLKNSDDFLVSLWKKFVSFISGTGWQSQEELRFNALKSQLSAIKTEKTTIVAEDPSGHAPSS